MARQRVAQYIHGGMPMLRGSLAAFAIAAIVVVCCLLIGANDRQKTPATSGDAMERVGVDFSTGKAIFWDTGIVFTKVGKKELRLDLARPSRTQPEATLPAIICLHGGGWIGGERQQMKGTIEALARRGYVAVSPDYRLAPQDRFPAQIEDCKAVVRWLRANAKNYGINPQKIGVFGFSAGAHLACLLGVTGKDDSLEGTSGNAEQSSAVQAVVSFFGPTDFTRPGWSKEVRERHLVPFLGGTAEEKADVYRRASPITYAGKNAPPFLFVHGTADDIVPIQQSEEMVKKLREAGVSARLITMQGEGHGWGWSHEHRLTSLADMMTFFDENLKK
jgi:acetyl esterase/lipase